MFCDSVIVHASMLAGRVVCMRIFYAYVHALNAAHTLSCHAQMSHTYLSDALTARANTRITALNRLTAREQEQQAKLERVRAMQRWKAQNGQEEEEVTMIECAACVYVRMACTS